jgi:hypothetical protein
MSTCRRSSHRAYLLLALLASFAAAAVLATSAEPRPSALQSPAKGTLPLHLSPTGSDKNTCTKIAPCASFARAFARAQPGQVVQVAGGFYGCDADIVGSKNAYVTFRGTTSKRARTTCELSLEGVKHIAFENLNLAGLRMGNSSSYVRLKNVHVTCRDEEPFRLWDGKCSAGIFGSPDHFLMRGGSVGPTYDNGGPSPGNSQIGIRTDGGPAGAVDLTIDGVRFHDNRRAPDAHTECLMVGGGDGITIRNSRFDHCSIFDIFVTWWSFVEPNYPPPKNIVLENNWFGEPLEGNYAVRFSDSLPRLSTALIRYNSWTGNLNIDESIDVANVRVIGNVGSLARHLCEAGVVYSHNVWQGAKCGATDRNAPSGFVNADAFDLRLKRTSAALGRGDPKNFPARDIFGLRRPQGLRPDAGAVELSCVRLGRVRGCPRPSPPHGRRG